MLYGVDRPFQFVHADFGNLEFLGISANLLSGKADLFTTTIYTYPMRSRRLLSKKLHEFYKEVSKKRNNQKMRLQVDQEFQQNEIKQPYKKFSVEMFLTKVRGGKAPAADQKFRGLKKRMSKNMVICETILKIITFE